MPLPWPRQPMPRPCLRTNLGLGTRQLLHDLSNLQRAPPPPPHELHQHALKCMDSVLERSPKPYHLNPKFKTAGTAESMVLVYTSEPAPAPKKFKKADKNLNPKTLKPYRKLFNKGEWQTRVLPSSLHTWI